ncbi:hypothetical protein PIB30_071023, partial [Stylosanthes scabra]|nr:hypothetical protein [Stylosanthes scabra]
PTSFAPIIEMAMTIVEHIGGQYHVLLIIAYGQVTRSVDTELWPVNSTGIEDNRCNYKSQVFDVKSVKIVGKAYGAKIQKLPEASHLLLGVTVRDIDLILMLVHS